MISEKLWGSGARLKEAIAHVPVPNAYSQSWKLCRSSSASAPANDVSETGYDVPFAGDPVTVLFGRTVIASGSRGCIR